MPHPLLHAGLALFVDQHIGDHRRRQLRRTPILDVRCKWRKKLFRNEAEERVCVSPETGAGSKARLNGIEVDARCFAGELQSGSQLALFRRSIRVITDVLSAARLPLATRARPCGNIAPASKASRFRGLAFGILYAGNDEDDIRAIGRCGIRASVSTKGPR